MSRIGTAGSVMGIAAGSWSIASYILRCNSPLASCPAASSVPPGLSGTLVAGLGAVLVLVSFVSFVGPFVLYYAAALVCVVLDVIEGLNYASVAAGSLYVTLTLVTLALVLGVLAATRKGGVSEQSHPMNLPVFG